MIWIPSQAEEDVKKLFYFLQIKTKIVYTTTSSVFDTEVKNKKMNAKNKNFAGFTIIELVVVIIVIAMLSTIAIALFQNHLKRGRDSFRKSNVDTIATLVKLDRIKQEESGFDLIKPELLEVLRKNSINSIVSASGHEYFYGYSAKKEDFFAVVCGEVDREFFVEGTPAGIMAVRSKNAVDVCDGSSVPIKERPAPLDSNALNTDLDAYTIYQLS